MLTRRSLVAAALLPLPAAAVAQVDYPRQPIRMIVAFPRGSGTDARARVLASLASQEIGQPVVVANQAGAGGQLGWTEAAQARPDGYTVAFINLPRLHTIILDPERKALFRSDSLVPVINQVLDPGVIWVKGDSPWKTLADLMDRAKASPGQLSACTTGLLSDDHLAILMTEEATRIDLRIVHLDGEAQQLTGVLDGNVDMAFGNVAGVVKRMQSGEIRVLAVMDTQRSPFLADVPTTSELGYPAVISSSTCGVAVPRGTPQEVIAVIQASFARAMANPVHVRALAEAGLGMKVMVGEDYAKFYRDAHATAARYTEWALKLR